MAGLSEVAAAFAAQDAEQSKKLCKTGKWFASLTDEDRALVEQRLATEARHTVYRAVAGLAKVSDSTWDRHVARECMCFTNPKGAADV